LVKLVSICKADVRKKPKDIVETCSTYLPVCAEAVTIMLYTVILIRKVIMSQRGGTSACGIIKRLVTCHTNMCQIT
jgi:hypothetical protein